MASSRLRLYRIDARYVQELQNVDRNVMSTSPSEGKENRPFVGVVIPHGESRYCIPLSSPKPKHRHMKADRDFSKIEDRNGKLIGVLNFNNMIPVCDSALVDLDLTVRKGDSESTRAYKELMRDQLTWCNANRELIARKANKLYRIVVHNPTSARGLVKRCCDFKQLEQVRDRWASAKKGN